LWEIYALFISGLDQKRCVFVIHIHIQPGEAGTGFEACRLPASAEAAVLFMGSWLRACRFALALLQVVLRPASIVVSILITAASFRFSSTAACFEQQIASVAWAGRIRFSA
jgi:hypothetical protein